jgi:hypothetical protein
MSATYTIANVQHSLQALKEQIPPNEWADTPLPVIIAPHWWMEEIRKDLGGDEGLELAEIHGCSVIRQDDMPDPMLIDHDGKMYPILPSWMRAKQESQGGEDL